MERFLADLRALRDLAALGHDELAARTHYPSGILKEAENGPSLPGLPILAAYVRACDGDIPEWEERWRRLGYETHADPGLPFRPVGASPAAVAGARAGISIAPPEVYDSQRIRAALRGQHGHAAQAAQGPPAHQETAAAAPDHPDPDAADTSSDGDGQRKTSTTWDAGAQRGASPSWGAAADPSNLPANGSHYAGNRNDGHLNAATTGTPDHAGSPDSIRHDPFSGSWLHDSEVLSSPPGPGVTPESVERGPAPRQEENRPASPGRTDFWTSSAAPAGIQQPAAASPPVEPQPVEERPIAGASWPPPRGAAPDLVPGPGTDLPPEGITDLPQAAGSAAPAHLQTPTEPAVSEPTAAPPSEPSQDRLFPLRLLVVIVAAALIGSILVMLIR